MVKQYETVFIATPVLSEEQMKETVKKYIDLLTSKGAEIVYENNWGMRKLAYPIRKKTTGFYYLRVASSTTSRSPTSVTSACSASSP